MKAQATHHHLFDTAIGECGVAWNARGLVGVQLPEKDRGQTELRLAVKCRSTHAADVPPWVQSVISEIQRYLGGQQVDFSTVTVDFGGLLAKVKATMAAADGAGSVGKPVGIQFPTDEMTLFDGITGATLSHPSNQN